MLKKIRTLYEFIRRPLKERVFPRKEGDKWVLYARDGSVAEWDGVEWVWVELTCPRCGHPVPVSELVWGGGMCSVCKWEETIERVEELEEEGFIAHVNEAGGICAYRIVECPQCGGLIVDDMTTCSLHSYTISEELAKFGRCRCHQEKGMTSGEVLH